VFDIRKGWTMGFAVREITLEFASAGSADGWVAAHVPSGLVVGSVTWQLVVHRPGAATVRLVQGYEELAVAGDWHSEELPELGDATSMTVQTGEAELYVGGTDPGKEGPGRVWKTGDSFSG
jgi:hypothetical protein